ncbi:MAG: PAS domain S-box protein [Cyanobacteria bacterium P01_D01_bin.73]
MAARLGRLAQRVSMRWVLALLGGSSAALLMIGSQWLLIGGQSESRRPIAQALQRSQGEQLLEAISDHLAVPALVAQINSDNLKLGTVDASEPEQLEAFLGQQIRQFSTLRFIGFANEAGLLSAVQRTPQGSVQILSGQSAANGSPGRLWIYNTDSQGDRASVFRTLPTYDLDKQPWYRQPALAGQTIWTPPVRDDDGNWSISLGQPVVDRQGRRLGILSVTVALGPLGKVLDNRFQGVEGQAFVLDPATEQILLTVGGTKAERRASPRVVAPGPALKSEFPLVHAGAETLRRTFGSWSTVDRSHQIAMGAMGRSYQLWVTPVQQGRGADWLVVSIVPAVADRSWLWAWLWVLAAGGVGAALGWAAASWLGRSLDRLERRFKLITAGKVDASFPMFPLEEVDNLSKSAQAMIRELRARLRMGEREKTELEERVRERTTALSLSETKFSKIFYASPSGICLMRIADGTVIDFNDSFLEIFGYSFEEMMGFTNMEFNIWQNPGDRTLVMHTLQRGSSVRNQEVAARTKSRELRMVLLSAESIYLHGMECALFVFHDITDYKRLEDDLRQSQRQLEEVERRRQWELLEGSRDQLRSNLTRMENMLGSVQDALVWTDGQGRVQWCNLAFEQLVQRDRPAILGAPLLDALPLHQRGELLKRVDHPVTQALRAVVGKAPYELVLGRDRRSVEISWSGVRFFEEADDATGAGNAAENPAVVESVSAVLTIRDISERKQLVAEVLRAKRFIDGIVENLPLAVYVKDVRQGFRHVLWNRASEGLFKISRSKAMGRTADELYFPEQAAAFRSQDNEAIETRRPIEISEQPFEAVDKNGAAEHLTLRTMKVPLFDAQGRILYLLCIAEDITQRQDDRAALMETQAQFRLLADQAGADLMFVHDVAGNILDVNQEACRSLGYERRELLTMNVADVDTLASLDQHDRIWAMMQPGQPVTLEGMYRCKDGRMFHVETRVGVRFSGELRIFLAMARDVSDRKQMEGALQQAEEKYRGIVENAVEGIYQCAPTGQFLSANRALVTMFGYEAIEQVLGPAGLNRTRRFYTDPERWDSFLTLISQTGEIYGFESQVYDAEGKSFWVSENARAVKDVDGRLLYYEGTMQNITERKMAEEALFAEQEKADRLLLNILPRPVAESLKQGEGTLAQMYDEATILFADLVGFTHLSAQMRPIELVNMLNLIFSTFDHLAEYHGLEKIKTVCDEYMVVGGLPLPMKDHVKAVAHLALDMQIAIQEYKSPDGEPFQIRIGINTGSVVAGVIGIKKFAYDLWGDTVNIASRMESHGEAGRIQVTQAVYEVLKDDFRFEDRGVIDIKGRGKMATYWLLGDRNNTSETRTSKAPIIIPGSKSGDEAVVTNNNGSGHLANGSEPEAVSLNGVNSLDLVESEEAVPMLEALGDLIWDEALFEDTSVLQDPTFIQDDG